MTTASDDRVTPAWTYRPGPDVSDLPPEGLVKAQALARNAALAGLEAVVPGMSEREIDLVISRFLKDHQVRHVWTITNVGVGANAHVCFPTQGPSLLETADRDVVIVDVHPILPDGHWGDCTRTRIIGDVPEAQRALADLERIHTEELARVRPGMPASDLFGRVNGRLESEGFELLDLLANIGHSLTAGAAYLHNFIDAGNDTPMWGAWAVEPFARRDGYAVKIEDLVWFGRDACTII